MKHILFILAALTLVMSMLATAAASPAAGGRRRNLDRVGDNVRSVGKPGPSLGQKGKLQFGNDVKVNPSTDNPNRPHNEFAIAGNPLNPKNLIAGANDYSANNTSFTGVYYSKDGGASWKGGNLPCQPPSGGVTICPQGDPAVDFDGHGVAWFADLCFDNLDETKGGLCVRKSTDGGETWSSPVQIASNNAIIFYDRLSIAVDKRTSGAHAGRIYVTSTKFNDVDGPIVVIWSDDGITWTEAQVSTGTCCYQAANPIVADDGTLYIAYQWYEDYCNNNVQLKIRRSADGGASFGPETNISGAPVIPSGLIDPTCTFTGRQYLLANGSNIEVRHRTFAVLAVNHDDPNQVYAVWSDGRWGTAYSWTDPDNGISYSGRHADIAASTSVDGGLTWSGAVRVNDDADPSRDQFFPWVAAGPNGLLAVSYLDRRAEYEPSNPFLYNKTVQFGVPNGKLWGPARRVSDVSSDPAARLFGGGTSAFLGDYEQLYAAGKSVHPIWIDLRSGTNAGAQNIFTDRLQR